MARSFGRLFTSIWDDKHFRPLSVGAKLMYGFLISQDDLEHSGIIPFRPMRWARELGEPAEDVMGWVKELDGQRYVITDDEEGELLVRSLIRRDDVWKQPNVFKAAAASAKACKSARIKAALYHEVSRLTLIGTGRETHATRDELLSHLEPFANPSPNPPEGFPRGSGDHSAGDNGIPGEPSRDASRDGAGTPDPDGSVDNSGSPDETAGPNPSGTLGEPIANHSAGATGKGEGYGPVPRAAFPHSPTPSPVDGGEPTRPLWPAAVPDDGDSFSDEPPDIPALIAEVRKVRPEWSTRSIKRALGEPSVRERPWPVVRRAMILVAEDPASKSPGRLGGDGPWWHQAAGGEGVSPERPPWCGECDPETRMLGMDTDRPRRCPRCKPNARSA